MNPPASASLRLTTVDTGASVRIELEGDLDYDNADHLLNAVTTRLDTLPRPRDLHLRCGGLGHVDSMGLSILLMIRRHTDRAGVRLHLDDRSPGLDRLLTLTGTAEHFGSSPGDGTPATRRPEQNPAGDARTARPAAPDSTA